MLETLLRMLGVDLQAHVGRLRDEVNEFKDRTTREIKHEVAEAGVTIGLAFVGFVFAMWTVVVGLIALFLWVDDLYGPFIALGAVALVTAVVAAIAITVAASRGGKKKDPPKPVTSPPRPAALVAPPRPAAPMPAFTPPPNASFLEAVTAQLSHRAIGPTSDALDAAADMVRRGPKEAVVATLAAAVAVGIFFGRRN
jgi:hypothetical protein